MVRNQLKSHILSRLKCEMGPQKCEMGPQKCEMGLKSSGLQVWNYDVKIHHGKNNTSSRR